MLSDPQKVAGEAVPVAQAQVREIMELLFYFSIAVEIYFTAHECNLFQNSKSSNKYLGGEEVNKSLFIIACHIKSFNQQTLFLRATKVIEVPVDFSGKIVQCFPLELYMCSDPTK